MSILLRHPLSHDTLCRRPGRFPVADKAARTVDGIVFDSKKEATRYAELKLLQRAGEISHLECQFSLPVSIGEKHYTTFTVDFKFWDLRSHHIVYEETKSSGTRLDAAYRLRRKAAELFYCIKITEHIA